MRRLSLLPLICLCVALPTSAQDGGISVFAAEPLFAAGNRISLTHIYEGKGSLYRGSNEVSDSDGQDLDEHLDEHRVVLGIDRGLLPDFTVSALVPYVRRDLDTDDGNSNSSGLGDIALLGKYRFYEQNWPQSAFNVAVIGGLELPTGITSERQGGMRLSPGLQPGSGSWDPFIALSSILSQGRYRLDAGAFFKVNAEGAQDFDRGNFFSFSLTGKYRFWHEQYPGASAGVKLGLQYRHEGRAEQNDVDVADSGSSEIRGRTGFSWHPAPNIDVSVLVEIPLYQDFNGEQLALDYRTFLAVGLRF